MPKEHKCICLRSEAFIPEATSQSEGLSAIMSKEWTKEVESSDSIIKIYRLLEYSSELLGTLNLKRSFTI
jgi:hypothetical protein